MAGHGRVASFVVGAFYVLVGGTAAQQYDGCTSGPVADIGNGRCDAALNVPSCGYDGGDCCPCTCSDGPAYSCSDNDFDCIYPECNNEQDFCEEEWQGDGWCDPANNHAGCNWDGGDCCECTCEDTAEFTCGSSVSDSYSLSSSSLTDLSFYFAGFNCEDPACFDPRAVAEFPGCTGDWMKIGDGKCTQENNNAACGYDGGDCCLCTCSGVSCETSYYDCLDPGAHQEFFNCAAPPPAALPCSGEVQQTWVVENSAQARALAAAARCSGGSFEVEWRGSVVVDTPIYVVDGTVLSVKGAGFSPAQIDGNHSAQLFRVINATLHASDIEIHRGSGMYGGAIAAAGSSLKFDNANFTANVAKGNGGAVFLSDSSSMSCAGVMFEDNHASGKGGAIFVEGRSSVSCGDDGKATVFRCNVAEFGDGGALHATDSEIFWTHAEFHENWAGLAGGALHLSRSEVFWTGETFFMWNGAYGGGGGAVLMMNGSMLAYTGETGFMENYALTDGGAIGSPAFDSVSNPVDSTIEIGGATTFFGNNCTANGGGLALLGACSVVIVDTADVSFTENRAGVAGGAVYVSSSGLGPTFPRVDFVSNEAQIGGAAAITGSGSTKDTNDPTPPNPTTFDRCQFINNRALAAGGAVESAAGHDVLSNCLFRGNTARVGGALRLAGTAIVRNCSFVENLSDDGEGPAVSNIGVLLRVEGNSFHRDIFNCPLDTFLNFTLSDDPFEVFCDGCQSRCDGCSFEDPPLVPMCSEVMEYTNSSGGSVTLEELWIEPGYWRATETSTDILACYNADACLGGVTGAAEYCNKGYKGPYCSVCSPGFSPQLGATCNDCSDSAGKIVLATLLLVGVLVTAVAVISYLMSGHGSNDKPGLIQRMSRYIPLQSVKIIIVAWQILTQFASVANITYPAVYQRFLDFLDIFNFDLGLVFSYGCLFEIDFHHRLLISTLGPIAIIVLLGFTYAAAALVSHGASQRMQVFWNKHVFLVLLVTFLVYSSVSSVLFKTFACEDLDDDRYYLRADYRIECDSTEHKHYQLYAGFMIVLYAIGIPALYGFLLFRDRGVLELNVAGREVAARIKPTSDLWRPYKPSAHYYEVVECARRILLAGVVVFIYPNTSAQIAVTLMMAFVFAMISEALAPYVSRWDTWISRMGHVVVFVSMFVALLLKVDVSDERASSQKVFDFVLISVHVCMLAVVVVETFFVAASLRAERREDKALNVSVRCITESYEDDSEATFDMSNPYPGLPRIFD